MLQHISPDLNIGIVCQLKIDWRQGRCVGCQIEIASHEVKFFEGFVKRGLLIPTGVCGVTYGILPNAPRDAVNLGAKDRLPNEGMR